MPPDVSRPSIRYALIAAIEGFAAAQSDDSLAKMIGFFHLAKSGSEAALEFEIEASGVLVLSIKVQGEE